MIGYNGIEFIKKGYIRGFMGLVGMMGVIMV